MPYREDPGSYFRHNLFLYDFYVYQLFSLGSFSDSPMSDIIDFDVTLDRNIQPSPLSEKDQVEKAKKCEFVQGLLLSTFLEDDDDDNF